jgi:hypothetical protein
MTSKRTPINRPPRGRITPEIAAAWKGCDFSALHCALRLHLHERSPLPSEITALGVSEDHPPPSNSDYLYEKSYEKALALQRELLAVAGWPDCRETYQRNLRNAEEWRDDCARLVRSPDARPQGTGMDTASLRRDLKEARAEVAYRKKLLAGLDAKETA